MRRAVGSLSVVPSVPRRARPPACCAGGVALTWAVFVVGLAAVASRGRVAAQEPVDNAPARGSLIEDRAARKLLEAGDARFAADEFTKALEVWQSVIERYPRGKVRFAAHMRVGKYLLERERAYDRARGHFETVASDEQADAETRAEALLKTGVCHYESRNFGKCFQVMRDVIEKYPASEHLNQAYYHIGLGHFQLGHYSRAIAALEKVGTALSSDAAQAEKVEAGKRLFLKIEDADLAALAAEEVVAVTCETKHGDRETMRCVSLGANVRVVLGSTLTRLGKPTPGNGALEVRGGDRVRVSYIDRHTSDRQFDRLVTREVQVVGDALVAITDGAYRESLQGVVLGKQVNLRVQDADFDVGDGFDTLTAAVELFRAKSNEEIEAEQAQQAAARAQGAEPPPTELGAEPPPIDPWKKIDEVKVALREVAVDPQAAPVKVASSETAPSQTPSNVTPSNVAPSNEAGATSAGASSAEAASAPQGGAPEGDATARTGVFHAVVELVRAETPVVGNDALEALPGDLIRLVYLDETNSGPESKKLSASAKVIEGNLGGVRVTRTQISDLELKIQTQLKTASALTNIGNRYKEFGLKTNSAAKYQQALAVCEEITTDAQKLGGRLLEETYVQLWRIYFEMEQLDLAAAMCERLQRDFPTSGFVDESMLQLARVARKQGDLQRAIAIHSRLAGMPQSKLRGEAQFGVAECYEDLAKEAAGPAAAQLYDRAFQEYKRVYDSFPESGRVGEAVAKMANYYYQQKDYARAIDIFEGVLAEHPDAKFLDVILFNYGRCLYRLDRKTEARVRFDQLIAEFPESPLAGDAKKISEALAKAPK